MQRPMHKIFINDFGRLRSGWRLLLFVGGFVFLTMIWGIFVRLLYEVVPTFPYREPALDIVFRGGLLLIALGVGYLLARNVEDLPWRSLGLTLHPGWLRDLLIGSAIGFAALAVAVAIAMTAKGLSFSFNTAGVGSIIKSLIGSAVLFILAALAEEAMFRGYPLQTLARARLASLGVLLTLALFGAVHLGNPNVIPGVTFANTALAGLWLAVAYLRTRSLWLPLGVHWAWNWALGSFFGLPVSGLKLVANPLLTAADHGPFWLTGGSYGIEGGLACTIALVLTTIFLWRTKLISATPELLKLTSEENPKTPAPVLTIRTVDHPA
jgi:uncharacterized protein